MKALCGIVGYIGKRRALPIILQALHRASGKLRNLEDVIRMDPVDGVYGIGHTRWATHGRPTEENAHPRLDCRGDVVVVHNGIRQGARQLSGFFALAILARSDPTLGRAGQESGRIFLDKIDILPCEFRYRDPILSREVLTAPGSH